MCSKNNIAIVIQARMNSQRCPQKMMQEVGGVPLIQHVYQRCRNSSISTIVVATSDQDSDDPLAEFCQTQGIAVFRGLLNNVLKRFVDLSRKYQLKYLIRVCGDTPLVDGNMIDECSRELMKKHIDYVAYERTPWTTPFYIEAVRADALAKALENTGQTYDLEHVTPYVLRHPKLFQIKILKANIRGDLSESIRLTIDYPEDFKTINDLIQNVSDPYKFKIEEVIDYVRHSRV